MQLLTVISTIDDLNYPEKTDTYYIVNAPYIFSACWKVCTNYKSRIFSPFVFFCFFFESLMSSCLQVVKPLLQERTRRKIQVLQGCGKDELLKVSFFFYRITFRFFFFLFFYSSNFYSLVCLICPENFYADNGLCIPPTLL